MSEVNYYKVNSTDSYESFAGFAKQLFEKKKHVLFYWVAGEDRTIPQNRMFFLLYDKIGKSLYGGDADHARAECKLEIGVPILRRDLPDFCEVYDRVIRPHDYETKLGMIRMIQVSSLMSREQGIEYINTIFDRYAQRGVVWGDMITEQKNKLI